MFSTNSSLEVDLADCSTSLSVTYNDVVYNALQVHFHSPSEHTFGGGYFAAEAHIVHQDPVSRSLLVIGIVFDVAGIPVTNNSVLNTFWSVNTDNQLQNFESIEVDDVEFELYKLIPSATSRYVYSGSITVPPCIEGVQWVVYEQPIQISQKDYEVIRAAAAASPQTIVGVNGDSNRVPTLPLNGRTVRRLVGAINPVPPTPTSNNDEDNNNTKMKQAQSIAIAALIIAGVTLFTLFFVIFFMYRASSKQSAPQHTVQNPIGSQALPNRNIAPDDENM